MLHGGKAVWGEGAAGVLGRRVGVGDKQQQRLLRGRSVAESLVLRRRAGREDAFERRRGWAARVRKGANQEVSRRSNEGFVS